MYRIDNSSAVAVIPTPAGPGPVTNGFFFAQSPSLGASTIVDADWANAIQEEIANVIEKSGQTLSKTNRGQLMLAMESFATNGRVFQTSGTFTPPAGVSQVRIRAWGAGGGGGGAIGFGGANQGAASAAGGGGGAYVQGVFNVTPLVGIAVTIGAPGTAGTAAPTAGGTGGGTFVSGLIAANGGNGGAAAAATVSTSPTVTNPVTGGTGTIFGGSVANTTMIVNGFSSGGGLCWQTTATGTFRIGGPGGGTFGTSFSAATSSSSGAAFPGGGGGGGAADSSNTSGQVGAAGAGGLVLIDW